jgi:hypothetical protein
MSVFFAHSHRSAAFAQTGIHVTAVHVTVGVHVTVVGPGTLPASQMPSLACPDELKQWILVIQQLEGQQMLDRATTATVLRVLRINQDADTITQIRTMMLMSDKNKANILMGLAARLRGGMPITAEESCPIAYVP